MLPVGQFFLVPCPPAPQGGGGWSSSCHGQHISLLSLEPFPVSTNQLRCSHATQHQDFPGTNVAASPAVSFLYLLSARVMFSGISLLSPFHSWVCISRKCVIVTELVSWQPARPAANRAAGHADKLCIRLLAMMLRKWKKKFQLLFL